MTKASCWSRLRQSFFQILRINVRLRRRKTGRAVIEQAGEFRPDIVFMDIQMPGINGIDAIKEIRKFNNSAIFIVVTAYDKFGYAQQALSLGCWII